MPNPRGQVTKTEELVARLKGRMENSWRTASLHADPQVRHDAEIRAQAYENAMADAQAILVDVDPKNCTAKRWMLTNLVPGAECTTCSASASVWCGKAGR